MTAFEYGADQMVADPHWMSVHWADPVNGVSKTFGEYKVSDVVGITAHLCDEFTI